MNDLTHAKYAEIVKTLSALPGLAVIKGRCIGVRKFQNRVLHLCALPAEDAYSMPALVEVESNTRRVSAGEDCSLLVRLGGFPNNFIGKDEDGRPADVKSARNTLQAVFVD